MPRPGGERCSRDVARPTAMTDGSLRAVLASRNCSRLGCRVSDWKWGVVSLMEDGGMYADVVWGDETSGYVPGGRGGLTGD